MKSNHKEEVELLKKESEIPLEDLLKELPPNYLEERDKSLSPSPEDSINVQEEEENNTDGDAEFTVASDESSDDENTIMEQEEAEGNSVDHRQELDDLKAENEMSIDELMAKYGNMSGTMEVDEDSEHGMLYNVLFTLFYVKLCIIQMMISLPNLMGRETIQTQSIMKLPRHLSESLIDFSILLFIVLVH